MLGARAGRQRYEQIAATARKVAGNPKVQAASRTGRRTPPPQQAAAAAEVAKDKVSSAASTAADKVPRRRRPGRDAGHAVARRSIAGGTIRVT